jgi:hypothetical protein
VRAGSVSYHSNVYTCHSAKRLPAQRGQPELHYAAHMWATKDGL